MKSVKLKAPQKGLSIRLREMSKKRRESMKPSREFLEIFEKPAELVKEARKL